jgi:hypothetical protein
MVSGVKFNAGADATVTTGGGNTFDGRPQAANRLIRIWFDAFDSM